MKEINQLQVKLEIQGKDIDVGELVQNKRKIYFKFYQEFINSHLSISPIKLPHNSQILSSDVSFFDGMHGVFYDSLPDGWGRLLMDRYFLSQGYALHNISPLQRLAFVNNSSPGALRYLPILSQAAHVQDAINLIQIATEIKSILEGAPSEILDQLITLGGSSGGARPKINIFYNSLADTLVPMLDSSPLGFEPWIIKFPNSSDPSEIGKIEYAYYLMAKAAGIEMQESRLFKSGTSQFFFGTKRFDRTQGQNMHMISAAGLLHDNYRMSNMDYGHLMDATFKLEQSYSAYDKILRLASFNVFAHNRDDHSKNFSFLMDASGKWRFAPAYDLTFSNSALGHHSTTIAGESKSPDQTHLMQLAKEFSIDKPHHIIDEVRTAIGNWKKHAAQAQLSKQTTEMIHKIIC